MTEYAYIWIAKSDGSSSITFSMKWMIDIILNGIRRFLLVD